MRKKAEKKSLRQAFASRSLRAGSYSLAVCAVVLVIAVLVNLIVAKLPARYTELDISKNDLYSLSDYSKQIASNVNIDVTIYHLTTAAGENTQLTTLLKRYEDLNDHIHVQTRDPQISQIATKYTKDEVDNNSLIFVSEKRSKVVQGSRILGYSEQAQMYAMYGQSVSPDEFSGEREITSALSFVTTDVLPKVYNLTSHGEFELPSSVQSSMASENIELVDLDLVQEKEVPQDCACLMILSPDTDLMADEAEAIKSYFTSGGKLLLSVLPKDALQSETPNYDSLLAELGLEVGEGFVVESDSSSFFYYPNYLLPTLQSHEITDPILENKYHVYFPITCPLNTTQSRSSLEITPLLTTSDASFARLDANNESAEKSEGDVDGPFDVAYAVTETVDGTQANAVVFGTPYFLDDSFASFAGNMNLFLNSLKWMCDLEENISVVETKSLSDYGALEVNDSVFGFWFVLLTVVIPAVLLIVGIVVFVRRKKR